MTTVGSVAALWRYPVTSMAGETLAQVEVDDRGSRGTGGGRLARGMVASAAASAPAGSDGSTGCSR